MISKDSPGSHVEERPLGTSIKVSRPWQPFRRRWGLDQQGRSSVVRSGQTLNRFGKQSQERFLTDWAWGVRKRGVKDESGFMPELLDGCHLLQGGRSRSGEEQRELGLGKLVSDALWFPSGGAGKSVGYKTPESRGRSELEIWLWEWSF